jgi:flavin-binding protein dodecin
MRPGCVDAGQGDIMKRSRRIRAATGPAMTGRDGAIDFAAKAAALRGVPAEDHIYRVIELVGTSETSIEDAISHAISRADRTLRNLRWFEVVRTSGHVADGQVRHYQVTLKVGSTMEDVA